MHRGALKDHMGVMRVIGEIDKHEPAPRNFMPQKSSIDAIPKFTPRCTHNSSRGLATHGPNWGKLPTISQGIYSNLFMDVPDFIVDRQVVFANTHGDRTRFFDCGGFCR